VGGRSHDVLGELVDPLLDLELVLVELQGEIRHRAPHGTCRRGCRLGCHLATSKLPDGNMRKTLLSRFVRAVAYQANGTLVVVDKPEPRAGPGQAVVAVERCGICGSDLHLRRSGMLAPGAVMGHEFAGTVVARGDEATTLAEGDRVAVLPAVRCGRCRSCLEGRDAICLEQMAFMLGIGTVDGA